VTLALAGRHNVTNALAAAAVGVALDVPLAEIARGLAGVRPVKGRCVWREAGDVRILDDTYNASPVSVRAALETIAAHRGDHRVVVVLGDMFELGAITDEAHREAGRLVARLPADEFVGVGRHAMVHKVTEEYAQKLKYMSTPFEQIVVHVKLYNAEGVRRKYSVHIRVLNPQHSFESKTDDWDLSPVLHKGFEDIIKQMHHKLHTDITRPR
jgi:UDP-N-acetylmuramyl pentapeptide synthase